MHAGLVELDANRGRSAEQADRAARWACIWPTPACSGTALLVLEACGALRAPGKSAWRIRRSGTNDVPTEAAGTLGELPLALGDVDTAWELSPGRRASPPTAGESGGDGS